MKDEGKTAFIFSFILHPSSFPFRVFERARGVFGDAVGGGVLERAEALRLGAELVCVCGRRVETRRRVRPLRLADPQPVHPEAREQEDAPEYRERAAHHHDDERLGTHAAVYELGYY